jgi:hypothetical protein
MKKIFSNLYVKTILIIVLIGLLSGAGFYIFVTQLAKVQSAEILTRISEAAKLNEELEKLRIENLRLSREKARLHQEKTVSEIISFDENLGVLKKEFNEKINLLPYKIDTKLINIRELKKIAENGLAASADFKSKLQSIGIIPEPFNDYYNLLIVYLDNSIRISNLTLAYLDSKDYSVFDDGEISQLFKENVAIFKDLEQERIRIFEENKIDSLLE